MAGQHEATLDTDQAFRQTGYLALAESKEVPAVALGVIDAGMSFGFSFSVEHVFLLRHFCLHSL